MKKFFLSVIMFTAVIQFSQAQNKIGLRAGHSYSIQDRNDATDSKLISSDAFKGLHIGLFAEVQITRHLYVQPQIMYAKRGSKYMSADGDFTKVTLKYVETPINLLFKADAGFATLYAGAGPVLSFGVGGKVQQNDVTSRAFGGDHEYRRIDIGANALAGLEFRSGLSVGLGYQMGFRDISRTADVKAKSISLTVSQSLQWGRKKNSLYKAV